MIDIPSTLVQHGKMVGSMPTKQLEGKVRLGHVLVAWASRPCLFWKTWARCPCHVKGKKKKNMGGTPMTRKTASTPGRLWFAPPKPAVEEPKKEPRKKVKNDPKLIAAARELRDRWLEQVNAGAIVTEMRGRYDVSRGISASAIPMPGMLSDGRALPALPAHAAA
jgi:hypothetical protein